MNRFSIVLFGGGRMGQAMVQGWLRAGVSPRDVNVIDPKPSSSLCDLARDTGVAVNAPLTAEPGRTVVLAIKPQIAQTIRPILHSIALPDTLIVSVLAGVTLDALARLAKPAIAVVRSVPNLPGAIGYGVTAAIASKHCNQDQRATAASLLASMGTFLWLEEEAHVNAVTGLSGSGPAYVFYLVECLTRAGEKAGLPRELATRLARETIYGAGQMLHHSSDDAADLRDAVTSPAGTTEAGLNVLMREDRLADMVDGTVRAAAERAAELAN